VQLSLHVSLQVAVQVYVQVSVHVNVCVQVSVEVSAGGLPLLQHYITHSVLDMNNRVCLQITLQMPLQLPIQLRLAFSHCDSSFDLLLGVSSPLCSLLFCPLPHHQLLIVFVRHFVPLLDLFVPSSLLSQSPYLCSIDKNLPSQHVLFDANGPVSRIDVVEAPGCSVEVRKGGSIGGSLQN
jgi:hypothetical protein